MHSDHGCKNVSSNTKPPWISWGWEVQCPV